MRFNLSYSIRSASLIVATLLWGATLPAAGQVTSASVAGVVKDAQGGVIPGATVILIREKLGTKSAPVITGGTGDFVFPSVVADTYTIEVTMSGFKTLRRSGISVSPGDRLAIGALTIEVGGTSEVVDVKAEARARSRSARRRSTTCRLQAARIRPLRPSRQESTARTASAAAAATTT
jgi:hypothetical protein